MARARKEASVRQPRSAAISFRLALSCVTACIQHSGGGGVCDGGGGGVFMCVFVCVCVCLLYTYVYVCLYLSVFLGEKLCVNFVC